MSRRRRTFKELSDFVDQHFALAVEYFERGRHRETRKKLAKIARKELGYSKNIVDADIVLSLKKPYNAIVEKKKERID